MLTRAALKNPYAVFAICMIALLLGAVSYKKMRVDIFPEIKIPTILVTTFYRGMSPTEMEGAITLRMEQRFVEASYVEHIESQSLAGMSYIKVFFQPEYGIDAAQSELTSLAYSIIRLLPPGVYPPSVYKFGVASLPGDFGSTGFAAVDANGQAAACAVTLSLICGGGGGGGFCACICAIC